MLIGIGIFTYLSYRGDVHHHRRFTRYLSIISTILVGLGLALLSTAVLTDASSTLGSTPWTLPLLLFLLLIRTYSVFISVSQFYRGLTYVFFFFLQASSSTMSQTEAPSVKWFRRPKNLCLTNLYFGELNKYSWWSSRRPTSMDSSLSLSARNL